MFAQVKNIIKINALLMLLISTIVFDVFGAISSTAFTPDLQPIGYVGQPVPSNVLVSSGTEKLYAGDYNSTGWIGKLHAYAITASGSLTFASDGTPVDSWADNLLDEQDFNTGRKIVTRSSTGNNVPFRWDSLSPADKILIDSASPTTDSKVIDYVRGSKEISGYRTRSSVLGDIIHSTPVFVEQDTVGTKVNKTVFVGANDGMLHAFNADTGAERFAYVPSMLFSKLKNLTTTPYTHKYYVDGRMDVKTVDAKKVLVGTLGAGGKGLFALDVTAAPTTAETEADVAKKILWEKTNTSTGFTNLGYTYAAPSIVSYKYNGSVTATRAAIVGNGYGNSGNYHATLLIINPTTGDLISEIDTNVGDNTNPNGLSTPSFWDSNRDGNMDIAYAGDMYGNLWKFDLTTYSVTRLFTSVGAASGDYSQAITMAPAIMEHPSGGTMVTFATGRLLNTGDIADTSNYYAYGIWDGAPSENTQLLNQTMTEVTYNGVSPALSVRVASSNAINWTRGNHKGWRLALPAGERVVGDGAFIFNGFFQFSSTKPVNDLMGDNWWNQLNALTGGDSGQTLFDLNKDGIFDINDKVVVTAGSTDKFNVAAKFLERGARSQMIGVFVGGTIFYLANVGGGVPFTETSIETVTADGILNGHFDIDIVCNDWETCPSATVADPTNYQPDFGRSDSYFNRVLHSHAYDDYFNVVGIDFLYPSQTRLALRNLRAKVGAEATKLLGEVTSISEKTSTFVDIPGMRMGVATAPPYMLAGYPKITNVDSNNFTYEVKKVIYSRRATNEARATTTTQSLNIRDSGTRFKILAVNQARSPAARLSIGNRENISILNFQTESGFNIENEPSYTLSTIKKFKVWLPEDAFTSKTDWGITRVLPPRSSLLMPGLQNLEWTCASSSAKDVTTTSVPDWRSGALVFQIVQDTVRQSDLQMNVQGYPELGYRLKDPTPTVNYGTYNGSNLIIGEYILLWHTQYCMSNPTWLGRIKPVDGAAGDAIPVFTSSDPKPGVGPYNIDYGVGEVTLAPVTNSNGSVTSGVASTVVNTSGVKVSTITKTTTAPAARSGMKDSEQGVTTKFGRVSWRELR